MLEDHSDSERIREVLELKDLIVLGFDQNRDEGVELVARVYLSLMDHELIEEEVGGERYLLLESARDFDMADIAMDVRDLLEAKEEGRREEVKHSLAIGLILGLRVFFERGARYI